MIGERAMEDPPGTPDQLNPALEEGDFAIYLCTADSNGMMSPSSRATTAAWARA